MSSSHCQFDSHPPELYGSLGADASQRSGGGYLPASVESPAPVEGTSPESQNTSTYMALRDEAREPSNEYDYIPGEVVDALAATSREERRGDPGEKKRVGNDYSRSAGDTSVGSRKVMNNSMYENHDIKPLLHPTLSRSETVKVRFRRFRTRSPIRTYLEARVGERNKFSSPFLSHSLINCRQCSR